MKTGGYGLVVVLFFVPCACTVKSGAFSLVFQGNGAPGGFSSPAAYSNEEKLARSLAAAGIPEAMSRSIAERPGSFFAALDFITGNGDFRLRILVDKQHPLPAEYEPDDLVELRYKSYRAGIADVMMLRREAEAALEEMASAAKAEGIVLTVSSAYRSYEYQAGSFERWTKRLGRAEAERVSARAGYSQHQLGLAVDFGSISNDFEETKAGRWVKLNAGRFGWSLSFPKDHEQITGYAWESWHYRYVGKELAAFINEWFGGIQHHALAFMREWEKNEALTERSSSTLQR